MCCLKALRVLCVPQKLMKSHQSSWVIQSSVSFYLWPVLYFFCFALQTCASFQLYFLQLILFFLETYFSQFFFFMHRAPYLHFKSLCSLHKFQKPRLHKLHNNYWIHVKCRRALTVFFFLPPQWCSAVKDKTQHHATLLPWSSVAPIKQPLLLKFSEQ